MISRLSLSRFADRVVDYAIEQFREFVSALLNYRMEKKKQPFSHCTSRVVNHYRRFRARCVGAELYFPTVERPSVSYLFNICEKKYYCRYRATAMFDARERSRVKREPSKNRSSPFTANCLCASYGETVACICFSYEEIPSSSFPFSLISSFSPSSSSPLEPHYPRPAARLLQVDVSRYINRDSTTSMPGHRAVFPRGFENNIHECCLARRKQ